MSDNPKREYLLPPQGTLILPGIAEIREIRNTLRQYPIEALWEYLEKTGSVTHGDGQVLRLLVTQAIRSQYAVRRLARKAVKK